MTAQGCSFRASSTKRMDSARSAANGFTNSVVTPASAKAAMRSATYPGGPISDMSRTSSSGTASMASCLRPDRYSSWIRSATCPNP